MFTAPVHIAASILAAGALIFQGFLGTGGVCHCSGSCDAACCRSGTASHGVDCEHHVSCGSPGDESCVLTASTGCCCEDDQQSSAEGSTTLTSLSPSGGLCRCTASSQAIVGTLGDSLQGRSLRAVAAPCVVFAPAWAPEVGPAPLSLLATFWVFAGPSLQSLNCVWRK